MSGLDNAKAALQILSPDHQDFAYTLPELTARLGHLKGTQDEWREAVAFLAAQYHAERRVSNAAQARDAKFVIDQIRPQIKWFDRIYGGVA